jgi:NADPH:quinone reductase-like Zn-dependent oxidoreductase
VQRLAKKIASRAHPSTFLLPESFNRQDAPCEPLFSMAMARSPIMSAWPKSPIRSRAEAGASYCWFFTEPNGEQLRQIAGLIDRGAIKPVIDREFAFEQLPDALTYLEAGRARGKLVLRVK